MKKIAILGVVAVVLFAVSAGVSYYLQGLQNKTTESTSDHGIAFPPLPDSKSVPAHKDEPSGEKPKAAIRGKYEPLSEQTVQQVARLNAQEENLRKREQEFANRKKAMEIIREDIRSQQADIDTLRNELDIEVKAIEKRMVTVDTKIAEIDTKRDELAKQQKEMEKATTSFDKVELERIRQMATIYDTLEPESAARILTQLASTGELETAVKILASMRERQAAKVLTVLSDQGLAAQLLSRLKGLKQPNGTGTGTP